MARTNTLLMRAAVGVGMLLLSQLCHAQPGPNPATQTANSFVVVFNSQTLPADAGSHVQAAGGFVTATLPSVGVVTAAATTVDTATFLQNLRKDPAIQAADYDVLLNLIAPAQIAMDAGVSPTTDIAHPGPTFSSALPADFFYTSSPQQWAVKRVGAQGGGIAGGSNGAWDTTKGAGVKIAILDTGVNPAHPDVSVNLIFNATFTSYDSANFGPQNCEVPDPADPSHLRDLTVDQVGHGTFTASLAAGAAGPGTGLMIGVAPEAKILNIKVLRALAVASGVITPATADTPFNRCFLRGGSGLFSWTLQGMLLASDQGADVISMSLGGFVPRNQPGGAALFSAFNRVANFVTARGAVVLAAAGNSALDLTRIQSFVELPAQGSNIIAVMATTNPDHPPTGCPSGTDCLASYSDFGSNLHGLSAPGGDSPSGGCAFSGTPCNPTGFIRGACSAGVPGTVTPSPTGYPASGPPPAGTSWACFSLSAIVSGQLVNHIWYVQATGTSASTPIAAGVAALVKAANPGLTPSQIRTILQQTAQDLGKPGYDPLFNFGLVDAAAAVQSATGR
jgi:lantibiotic leader peptide-processing serine protease